MLQEGGRQDRKGGHYPGRGTEDHRDGGKGSPVFDFGLEEQSQDRDSAGGENMARKAAEEGKTNDKLCIEGSLTEEGLRNWAGTAVRSMKTTNNGGCMV